jgi:metal-dependent amidase/aminoacylase/carboxypeptidase family protein
VGGTGFVALLKNGDGPTIMLRTELDALPVEEKTGLAYASKIHAKDDAGHDVPVMHACGHDLHMASLIATAEIMARSKNTWHGTLMLIGQPAEETISGAKAMIQDGLFTRFPKPDVGWHCMWAISSRQAWSRWCPESMTRTPTRCASPSTEKEATDRRRRLRSIPS